MASEDDGVLRNNYNNNESAPSLVSTVPTATSNTSARFSGVGSVVGGGDYRNIRTISTDGQTIETQPRREENPFSFKHFLNRDTTSSSSLASSSNSNFHNNSSVSATTAATHSNEQFKNSPNNNSHPIGEEHNSSGASTAPDAVGTLTSTTPSNTTTSSTFTSYQTSTGARPKVPQSILTGQPQAVQQQQQQQLPPLSSSSISNTSISSLVGEGPKMKRSPRFSSFDSQASLAEFAGGGGTTASMSGGNLKSDSVAGPEETSGNSMSNFFPNGPDFDRQYVHRSYSNYDMDLPGKNCDGSDASPHRRISPPNLNRSIGGLPHSPSSNPNHINLNPIRFQPGNRQHQKNHPAPIGSHIHGNRPVSEFSAALPDFVQDHWMDQWYCSLDMSINSPPNSPTSPVDFVEDLHNINNMSNPADICQTLPDFLSDGPIIHSSARLADVASGLPGLDSPEENSPSLQLSRIRLENDRLRRELDESRLSLADQTRRAGELERRLEQARSNETAYSASLAQSMGQVEENLDQSKKRAAAAQNQVSKLKQQVKQLTAEVDSLRRENDSLREDGAVGGDRTTRRPSRTHQLSRDLMKAASTAESNLRQLLTGVENLRLMAATIEKMDRTDGDTNNQTNPIINEEFLSDSDVDFDDFSGPAL